LKKQEGTEEEDDFNGLGRKRNCGRRNNFKRPRKKLFQNTGGNAGPTACSYKLFNTTGGFHFNSYLCIQTPYLITLDSFIRPSATFSPRRRGTGLTSL